MLRIFNFTRNVGGNLFRNTVREDRPKTSISPPSQFLFWFNEVPGQFTPSKCPNASTSILPYSLSGRSASKTLTNYVEFSEHHHHQDDQFHFTSSLTYLRAIHCSAILAVSYSILHDKIYSKYLQDNIQIFVPSLQLKSQCPVLSIKQKKSASAQPLSTTHHRKEDDLCCAKCSSEDLEVPLSTSDYSSQQSESDSSPIKYFTKEEEELLSIDNLIPDNVEEVLNSVRMVKNGKIEGFNNLKKFSRVCPLSQCYLAQMYENGIMTPPNLDLALELYSKSAESGIADAKYNLGVLLMSNPKLSVNIDGDKEALALIKDAAEEGVVEAQEFLGLNIKHKPSKTIPFDYQQLEELVKTGEILETNMASDGEDKWFALDFYRLAAIHGHNESGHKYNRLAKEINEHLNK